MTKLAQLNNIFGKSAGIDDIGFQIDNLFPRENLNVPILNKYKTPKYVEEKNNVRLLAGYDFVEYKLAWRSRKPISFISVYNIKNKLSTTKKKDLSKLKSDKKIAEKIGKECAIKAISLFGRSKNICIVAAPEGRTALKNGWHFASTIAKTIATEIGAKYLPGYFKKESKSKILDDVQTSTERITDGSLCIFVDDIITSGRTAIYCLNKLPFPRIAFIAINNL